MSDIEITLDNSAVITNDGLPENTPDQPATGFDLLGLHPALLKAVQLSGYTEPTAVQAAAIPAAITGVDLAVTAATGSGKTAAFVLPALHRLATSELKPQRGAVGPRVLVLTPTRELTIQVSQACDTYGNQFRWLRTATVVGGVPYGAQLRAIKSPLDVLVATPGRLLDHLNSGNLNLSRVEVLVLDEADRMLDMGFIEDIEAIAAATPATRQTLLFSATLAGNVAKLAGKLMRSPQRIETHSHTDTNTFITQRLHWADGRGHKDRLLERLLTDPEIDQAIVFTSTQIDAERVAANLEALGHSVAALHGGMPQGRRNHTLLGLRRRKLRILVATDVAARGIDVPTISHVINYGLPITAEDYVHRIGRTGRAGRTGLAITLAEYGDAHKIRSIERFTTQQIPMSTLEGLEPKARPANATGRPTRPHGGRGGSERARPSGTTVRHGAPARRDFSDAPRRARRP